MIPVGYEFMFLLIVLLGLLILEVLGGFRDE